MHAVSNVIILVATIKFVFNLTSYAILYGCDALKLPCSRKMFFLALSRANKKITRLFTIVKAGYSRKIIAHQINDTGLTKQTLDNG